MRSGRRRGASSASRTAGTRRVARRWSLRVDLFVPLGELTMEVFLVDEAPLFEEGALDPADQILDGALLLRATRPAQLDAEAEVERDPSKGRRSTRSRRHPCST